MKVTIVNTKNAQTGSVTLPAVFNEVVRPDLIYRAVVASQANARQPYGASPTAGKRHSVDLSKRRRDYKGTYGKGISRTPRKTLSRNGSQMMWVGAFAPNTRGGRQAHPPKAEKVWDVKINDQERIKAFKSALSATMQPSFVQARGHKIPAQFPVVLDTEFEQVAKTKDMLVALHGLGLADELARCQVSKTTSGKSARRGRSHKTAIGPLLVVSDSKQARSKTTLKSAQNIPGVQVVALSQLCVEDLAPGTHPGRLTLFTKAAIEQMQGMFK
jgi:large subunit ribosomal protein L4e